MSRENVNPSDDNTDNYSGTDSVDKNRCGVIMPIADTEGYPKNHWLDVRKIIYDAIETAGFEPNLVSFDVDVSTIHKRIVQNLYFNTIVVCDISSRNANVMFELGMRLAFDKPTIIIKEMETPYSFDIAGIEHLIYPRSLRHSSIEEFKEKLANKIKSTISIYNKDPSNFSVFLKHFGDFTVPKLEQKEVGPQEIILEELKEIKIKLQHLESYKNKNIDVGYSTEIPENRNIILSLPKNITDTNISSILSELNEKFDDTYSFIIRGSKNANNPPKLIINGDITPKVMYQIKASIFNNITN